MKMPKGLFRALTVLGFCAVVGVAHAGSANASPRLYFISPNDGAVVSSPFLVQFGLSGMGVAPAGVDKPKTGHHHLVIDAPLPALDETIPKDEHHRHFGGGQTEAMVKLAPGHHTLQLVLGDHAHVPLGTPWVSKQISITVK